MCTLDIVIYLHRIGVQHSQTLFADNITFMLEVIETNLLYSDVAVAISVE